MWQWLRKTPLAWLICLTFLAYFPFFSVEFVWDDEQFIYANSFVRNGEIANILTSSVTSGAGMSSGYYRPLTGLSFALDFAVWGLNPVMFRFTNIVLHILAGTTLYFLLKKLRMNKLGTLALAVLFLLHPIQVEAVSYINSRGDSLFLFFGLLSTLLFLHTFDFHQKKLTILGVEYSINTMQLMGTAIILLFFSIFSKEIGLTTIGLWALVFGVKYSTSINRSALMSRLWGVGLAAFFVTVYLVIRFSGLVSEQSIDVDFSEISQTYNDNVLVRLHTFTKVFFLYQQKLFFPYPLHMEHLVEPVESTFSWWLIGFLLTNSSWLWLGWRAVKKGNFWILLGQLWFFGMLVPVSGIIKVNGIMYEHWMYGPIIGWGMAFYGMCVHWKKHLIPHLTTFKIVGVLVAIVLACLTLRQNYFWSTPLRLYPYLLQYTESARIRNNLGMAYGNSGQEELAIKEYERALELGYNYPQIHHNMAASYTALGLPEEAIASYQKALDLQPDFYYSYTNLVVLLVEHHPEQVQGFFEEFMPHSPEYLLQLQTRVQSLHPELFK